MLFRSGDDWMVDTGDGSITAELPSGFNATVDADPGSDGRVHSDFTLANASGANIVGKKREKGPVAGQIGTGGKRVPTQLYNGYGDFVASLYTGLEQQGERLWM